MVNIDKLSGIDPLWYELDSGNRKEA